MALVYAFWDQRSLLDIHEFLMSRRTAPEG